MRSTIHVYSIAAGAGVEEVNSISEYQNELDTDCLPDPRLVNVVTLAVEDDAAVLAMGDVTWCAILTQEQCDGAGMHRGLVAAFLRIRPDGIGAAVQDPNGP